MNELEYAGQRHSSQYHVSAAVQKTAKALYRFAPLLVLPIAACLLSRSDWMLVGFLAVPLLLLLRGLAHGSPIPTTAINLPLLLLLTMLALSFSISAALELAVPIAAKVLAGVVMLFVLYDFVSSPLDLWRAAGVLAIVGLVLALVVPFTVTGVQLKLFEFDWLDPRLLHSIADTINPNKMAGAMVPLVPLALALVVAGPGGWRIVGAIALMPMLVTLVLLQSRGALLALGFGLILYATLYRRWVLPLVPILLLAGLAYASFSSTRLTDTKLVRSAVESLQFRQALYLRAAQLVAASPLTGTGLGEYSVIAQRDFPMLLSEPTADHSHNLFLQVALDTGVIGLASFFLIGAAAILALWQAYRSKPAKPLVIGVAAALGVMLVHGLVDEIMWGTQPGVILWLILGIAVAFKKIQNGHFAPLTARAARQN